MLSTHRKRASLEHLITSKFFSINSILLCKNLKNLKFFTKAVYFLDKKKGDIYVFSSLLDTDFCIEALDRSLKKATQKFSIQIRECSLQVCVLLKD